MSNGKMSDFVSVLLCGRNFDFESHINIFIIFDKKDMVSDLNMSHGEMPDFVSFPLFGFNLVRKLRNFDFKGH